jgi:hypothetical protein
VLLGFEVLATFEAILLFLRRYFQLGARFNRLYDLLLPVKTMGDEGVYGYVTPHLLSTRLFQSPCASARNVLALACVPVGWRPHF